MRRSRQAGFSLLELLIVIAIILVVAAVAVPNYMSARMAANESSAVGSLRAYNSALAMYISAFPSSGYPTHLTQLTDGGTSPCTASALQACLIDLSLAMSVKSGYSFVYTQDSSTSPSAAYSITADPVSRGSSGRRSFYTDQPGVIRFNANATATGNDPPIPM